MNETQQKTLRVLDVQNRNRPVKNFALYNNKKTCVVVIDMILGFTHTGALSSPRTKALVYPLAAALECLSEAKKVFICDRHTPASAEFKNFPVHCVTESEYGIVPELRKFADTVLYKNSVNGVFRFIRDIEPETFENFIITGCCTDICVLQFALSLKAYFDELDLDRKVIVCADYVETYDSPAHNAELQSLFALTLMETNGVEILKKLS